MKTPVARVPLHPRILWFALIVCAILLLAAWWHVAPTVVRKASVGEPPVGSVVSVRSQDPQPSMTRAVVTSEPGGRDSATVVSVRDSRGHPIVGARLASIPVARAVPRDAAVELGVTDSVGGWSGVVAHPDRCIALAHSDYQCSYLPAPIAAGRKYDVVMEKGASLHLSLTCRGQPVPDVAIELSTEDLADRTHGEPDSIPGPSLGRVHSAKSNDAGIASFLGLSYGRYDIRVIGDRYFRNRVGGRFVVVDRDECRIDVRLGIVVASVFKVSGDDVLWCAPKFPPGALVDVPERLLVARSLEARYPGHHVAVCGVDRDPAVLTLEAAFVRTGDGKFDLPLQALAVVAPAILDVSSRPVVRQSGMVTVHLTCPSGRRLTGGDLHVKDLFGGRVIELASGETRPMPLGKYAIQPMHQGFAGVVPGSFDVAPGLNEVVLALPRELVLVVVRVRSRDNATPRQADLAFETVQPEAPWRHAMSVKYPTAVPIVLPCDSLSIRASVVGASPHVMNYVCTPETRELDIVYGS